VPYATFAYHAIKALEEKNDGKFELVEIDIEYFIQEDEFASGVTVDEETHIVHGVVDPESEDFLTVGGNGFKLSGVQEAIDAAAQELWEALSAETAERIAADEELWDALSAETAARELADKELAGRRSLVSVGHGKGHRTGKGVSRDLGVRAQRGTRVDQNQPTPETHTNRQNRTLAQPQQRTLLDRNQRKPRHQQKCRLRRLGQRGQRNQQKTRRNLRID
jgi:hypothetical protein